MNNEQTMAYPNTDNNKIVPGFDEEAEIALEIRLEVVKDVTNCLILHLKGLINADNSNYFLLRITKAIRAGYIKLIMHLGGEYTAMSSVDIGCFLVVLKTVKPMGGDLALVDIPPGMKGVLQLLGFSKLINVTETIEQAIEFIL